MSENEISIVVKLKVVRSVKMTKSGDFPLRVFGKNWEEFPVALLRLAQLSTQLSLLRFLALARISFSRALSRFRDLFIFSLFLPPTAGQQHVESPEKFQTSRKFAWCYRQGQCAKGFT